MTLIWDEARFPENWYAVDGQKTIARIFKHKRNFHVVPCPDSPQRFHDERNGLTMEGFLTLKAAQQWVENF